MDHPTCFEICCIIFTIGCSVFITIGGIITLVNYQTDKHWITARTRKNEINLNIIETQRQIARDKYEHDQKMIGA